LRPLGLGFANIGALIMSLGHPYDSDEGRALAGSIMAIEHFAGYEQSARMARALRPFDAFQQNRSSMLEVMNMHLEAARIMRDDECDYVAANSDDGIVDDLWAYATRLGDKMVVAGEKYGYRNSQISVVAPTGTIGFMLGCDTTGIEPSIALVSYKLLAGDSDAMEKIVNQTVPAALRHLGYADKPWPSDYKGGNEDGTCLDAIVDYLDENDTIEGAPGLSDEHLPVFDCAFEAQNGTRSIHHNGHIDMMAAVQPFVSGAISKTVNVPNSASVEDIYDAYVRSWRRGLKAVAIYRDGSKRSQPLSTSEAPDEAVEKDDVFVLPMDQYQKHLLGEFEVFAPNDFDEDWANPSKATTIVQVNEALAEGDLTTEEIFDLLGREVAEEYFGVSRETTESSEPEGSGSQEPTRYRLPNDRPSINHKFRIGQHEGYLNVGFYPEGYGHGLDGQPGEVFITLSKQGSSLNGFADQFATALSIMLQYRIPLKRIVEKFSHVSFEPAGFTGNSEIRSAKSVVDYVARYLGRFTGEGSSPFTQGA
jgi:ribonucleoside-diphosphate reductase alpha chain